MKSGQVKIDGKPFAPKTPLEACRAGIAFIPEDRRNEGIVSQMDIAEESLPCFHGSVGQKGIIDKKEEGSRFEEIRDALNIVCTGQKQAGGRELSGGKPAEGSYRKMDDRATSRCLSLY